MRGVGRPRTRGTSALQSSRRISGRSTSPSGRLALLALLALCGGPTWGVSIDVGGIALEVPDPEGFVPVRDEMVELTTFLRQLVAPDNIEFASFIPAAEATEALQGEIPSLARRFSVQAARRLVSASVSTADFSGLKASIKSQNAEILDAVQKTMPDVMSGISEGLSREFDVDVALSVSSVLPLPVHEDSDRALIYSAIVSYQMTDETDAPTAFTALVSTAFVHLKGRVVFLYLYAGEDDLDWSRKASSDWVHAVVAANPSDASDRLREAAPRRGSGIDWVSVGEKGAVGALIGLLVAVVGLTAKRRRQD